MAKKSIAPTSENRTIEKTTPIRPPNSELRAREYLTPDEIGKLIEAAKKNHYGLRDSTMLLLASIMQRFDGYTAHASPHA